MDFIPGAVFSGFYDGEYMRSSIPLASDFYHPKFSEFLKRIDHPFMLHRKLWEFAYIVDALERTGVIAPGARGLAFGCGSEPLPALFAGKGCFIEATDAPEGANTDGGDWALTGQYAKAVEYLSKPSIISDDELREKVSFSFCDMNHIRDDLRNKFDFAWSACCLEHLGSIRMGLDFIHNSVKTLKIGGFACHTTEFNLSSNDETYDQPGLSLFRRRDIELLCRELTANGHHVTPLKLEIGATPIDYYVDIPPFGQTPAHIKLELQKFVCTSVGLLIRRGQ